MSSFTRMPDHLHSPNTRKCLVIGSSAVLLFSMVTFHTSTHPEPPGKISLVTFALSQQQTFYVSQFIPPVSPQPRGVLEAAQISSFSLLPPSTCPEQKYSAKKETNKPTNLHGTEIVTLRISGHTETVWLEMKRFI